MYRRVKPANFLPHTAHSDWINHTGLTSCAFTRWCDRHTSDKIAHYSIYRPERMRGWVGLGWLVTYRDKVPPPGVEPGHVTHPITNRARRRVTSLIRPTPLPLRHAATQLPANNILNHFAKHDLTPESFLWFYYLTICHVVTWLLDDIVHLHVYFNGRFIRLAGFPQSFLLPLRNLFQKIACRDNRHGPNALQPAVLKLWRKLRALIDSHLFPNTFRKIDLCCISYSSLA